MDLLPASQPPRATDLNYDRRPAARNRGLITGLEDGNRDVFGGRSEDDNSPSVEEIMFAFKDSRKPNGRTQA